MTGKNDFDDKIFDTLKGPLVATSLDTIQVNIGLQCNQRCIHCHVEATPDRTEMMNWQIMTQIIRIARTLDVKLIDITGGAPELNSMLPQFIRALRLDDHRVQVRSNLTILLEPEMKKLMELYRDAEVALVASLPCYEKKEVNSQRGPGVFEKSVQALIQLNRVGYGIDPQLTLDLVYNPKGPFLPPNQLTLEQEYRSILSDELGIVFNTLRTITNMPVGRFLQTLHQHNKVTEYQQLLVDAFNPDTIKGLMCRNQICIDWTGTLYDCDFNLALRRSIQSENPPTTQQWDAKQVLTRPIATGNHCFGCTAGSGSSCQGALLLK
ncbi:MAG: arsenosugar biosynthesis radical SAM protein ArsS [Candidatus Bathyarchaeota archaeon]|nr:MAG: arsenosugar biosynthesis radical SAM protein ArsS [Candidatus Bathyarchaeota archaeon]